MKFVLCAVAVIGICSTAHPDDGQKVAGMVQRNHCQARLTSRSNNRYSLAKRGDVLFPGDSITCTSTGSMDLLVFGQYVNFSRPGVPYRIPHLRPTHLSADEQMRQAALEQAFRRGGRERSAGESEGDSVTAEFFDIVLPEGQAFASMVNKENREIWHGQLEGQSGVVGSTAARDAVSHYSETGGGTLTVRVGRDGKQQELKYFVLSRDAEKQLDTTLASWDREPSSLMRHIGRASTLLDAMFFEAAAREYEAALAEAPENISLFEAAVDEYERAGDSNRANDLRAKLTSGSH